VSEQAAFVELLRWVISDRTPVGSVPSGLHVCPFVPVLHHLPQISVFQARHPWGIVFANHVGIHVAEHLGHFFWPLPAPQLPNCKRVSELFAVGLLATLPALVVGARQLNPEYFRAIQSGLDGFRPLPAVNLDLQAGVAEWH
jgi:hypothetical protein